MSVRAMSWVWDHSRSKPTQRLVLLAIADCANDRGTDAYPSNATLMAKTGLSERGVRQAITDLERLGELVVEYKSGPRGTNRYRVIMTDPARDAGSDNTRHRVPGTRQDMPGTRQDMHPAPRAAYPAPRAAYPAPRAENPAPPAPEPSEPPLTVQEPSLPAAAPPRAPTVTQRSKRITDAYAAAEPMCRWPAVNGIVIKAIKTERYTDDEIRDALLRLAAERRGVTVETLRVELDGLPPRSGHNSHRPATTDVRMAQGADVVARLEAMYSPKEITA